jgi:hypothetical protein
VRWTPAVENDVVEYRVAYGPENDPYRETETVRETAVALDDVRDGWVVSVKAVNQRGMEGWDWARVTVRQ